MSGNVCAVVICHGQTEYQFVNAIKSKLRLNIKIFARDKGRSSIQLDKLSDIFQNEVFRSVKTLTNEYSTIEFKKKELIGCKIFTLMDLDDCKDKSVVSNYEHGNISRLGKNHQLKPYIQPIYFKNNFEDALRDINFAFVAATNREKKHYIKVFDPVKGEIASEDSVRDLQSRFSKSDKTNVDLFLQYCLDNK
ncbi:hypothetical protein JMJ99_10440 [Companilactobacillus zhachilii]|uniref:hypothetical protein n=1 Tax=Companilactobacillus zhachilii TaxID=2304606 RepID=UPI001920EB6F|nr:hypothetical protein [Companilactobacillus zhachilii]MBL3531786.1 hypothetical protein [Companilactobacillus zhachilii]